MSAGPHKLFAFGNFQLDLEEAVLRRENAPVSLTLKAFRLLEILVLNHGHIVEKDKLISEIWADSFVEDGNLAVNVAALRKALGDDAANPRYIETVARRGYRFIAEVSVVPDDDRSQKTLRKKPVAPPWILTGRRLFAICSVGVIGFAVALSWYFSLLPFPSRSAPLLSGPFRSVQLTSTGNAGSAAISPDGKYVAYTDRNDGKWSIWLRQLATSENIRITPPSVEVNGGLTFSRDGALLYFVRGAPGNRLDLYRVSAFGGVPVKLIERTEGPVSISPDNKRLSFVRCLYLATDNCSLFVADVDGQNEEKLLTRARPSRIGDNQFSPDGNYIAFASGQSATGSSEFGLSMIDLKTGIESELTARKFFDIHTLRWLPGSQDLLLTARDKLADKNSLWRVSAVTGNVDQLTNDGTDYLKLSLDQTASNYVVVTLTNDFRVWIASVEDPNNPRELTAGKYASFTPDGKIVYQSNDSDIWMIDTIGGEKRQLTNDPLSDINPIMSADGRHIFFTSNRQGANHVWKMNIDGTDQRPITSIEGGYPRFVTPDGNWVYYQSGLTQLYRRVMTDGSDEMAVPNIDGFAHAISPDGRLLAYFFRDPSDNGKLKIGIRNFPDAALIQVLSHEETNSGPGNIAWSPDGSTIYFVSESNRKYALWRTSLDQARPTFVGDLGTENLLRFAISPDGRSILTIRGDWRHDAIMIKGLQ